MNIIQQEDLQPMNGFGLFPKRYACVDANDKTKYLIHSTSEDMRVTENAAEFFGIEDYDVVAISQALYRWLLEESSKSESLWMTTEGFQPEIPSVPLSKLPLDKTKCEQYNARLATLIEEYKEEGLFNNAPRAEDRFRPYQLITKVTEPGLHLLDEDDENLDTSVIYVADGNAHNDIDIVTNYTLAENYPESGWMYGLADTATQVVNYLNRCVRTYFTGNDTNEDWYVGLRLVGWMQHPQGKLILTTHFIPCNPDEAGGFRWHKNGEYIGRHIIEHEYLNAEYGIDYVMAWDLYLIEPENQN